MAGTSLMGVNGPIVDCKRVRSGRGVKIRLHRDLLHQIPGSLTNRADPSHILSGKFIFTSASRSLRNYNGGIEGSSSRTLCNKCRAMILGPEHSFGDGCLTCLFAAST